jgi:hypothetical protein
MQLVELANEQQKVPITGPGMRVNRVTLALHMMLVTLLAAVIAHLAGCIHQQLELQCDW